MGAKLTKTTTNLSTTEETQEKQNEITANSENHLDMTTNQTKEPTENKQKKKKETKLTKLFLSKTKENKSANTDTSIATSSSLKSNEKLADNQLSTVDNTASETLDNHTCIQNATVSDESQNENKPNSIQQESETNNLTILAEETFQTIPTTQSDHVNQLDNEQEQNINN